ncbi:MAG: response regulator [Bacteriovorax sp.]|nr:response regulator [Bacteriovorax sp.]
MTEKFDLYIVDDDPKIIEVMLSMLAPYELKIKTFTDPIEALKQLTDTPARVVFLDYNMPTLNGKNFIIRMSERYLFQYCTTFLVTAQQFDQMNIDLLHTLGFSKVIQKPFTEKDLIGAISEVVGVMKKKKMSA